MNQSPSTVRSAVGSDSVDSTPRFCAGDMASSPAPPPSRPEGSVAVMWGRLAVPWAAVMSLAPKLAKDLLRPPSWTSGGILAVGLGSGGVPEAPA
jgi:hypothetical protein